MIQILNTILNRNSIYKKLSKNDFGTMFENRHKQIFGNRESIKGATNVAQYMYQKKYTSEFTVEMNRTVNKIMDVWFNPDAQE